jgi:hypothetical protein
MSDTPETDKAVIKGVVPQWSSTPQDMVHAEFARRQEREIGWLKLRLLALEADVARAEAEGDKT